ncbi:TIGR02206 family membrane protein [Candidatus Xianfuyuplasma coldseepsis]|uniref:TIGR02206 family membrane protein n=1 Tax=Candidatus Xianfuyuplasma coldseepsis TaxID=2782163 RepID=A0A7L7KQ23_9MOLU|nr:TIGR02206 family membrane protein [Xianfuyuplasma coldseepsis]QMS84362.1 TIGR02206 family membrane protein [Xianfuyuplasma coldseepsis]
MFFETFFGHDIDFSKAATMFSIHHAIYMFSAVLTIVFIKKYAKKIRNHPREPQIRKIVVWFLIFMEIVYHLHNWSYPRFSIPLHICSFAVFMSIYVLNTNSKKVYNYLFFFGTLGGIMALTFPNSWGYTYLNFRYYHFLILHNVLIGVSLYYYFAYDYRITYRTLLNVYRTVLILAIFIHLFNLTFIHFGYDSNYWFITYIPQVVDGFFTNYPVYILTFLSAVFVSMNILFFVTHQDQIPLLFQKKSLDE